ncbi:hypothetical protein VTN00DRAFT_309 [Thermoascus crustaceus]|uniref:uncharacterized protein n=1 Tax=Thermoascus crustaceus TaxID=5088 RepID=UPI00374344E0
MAQLQIQLPFSSALDVAAKEVSATLNRLHHHHCLWHQKHSVHPSILVLTKIKRWMHIADSTRPASAQKAINDFRDIEVILRWLSERNMCLDFTAYPEKPKEDLMPGFHMMYSRFTQMRHLLDATMAEEDLALVKS